jgi:hypothetical protein
MCDNLTGVAFPFNHVLLVLRLIPHSTSTVQPGNHHHSTTNATTWRKQCNAHFPVRYSALALSSGLGPSL